MTTVGLLASIVPARRGLAIESVQGTLDLRVALGSTAGNIRWLVLAHVFGFIAVGAITGLAGALAGSRMLRSLLFQVSPVDPLTVAGLGALLLAVATVAG